MEIGIFGGTFDPPHNGHLIVAEHLREALGLDSVVFIPTCISPHKQEVPLTPPRARLAMVRRAIKGNAHFEASNIEVRRGGVSYTVDTLRELHRKNPDARLHLLIGMDNVREFSTWKEPESIFGLSRVVVMTRPGFERDNDVSPFIGRMSVCEVPEIDIASRDIRKWVKEGKSIRYLVPAAVRSYILSHDLYQS